MKIRLFIGTAKEDVKKKFRELSKVHHPDRGGSDKAFAELKDEYDYIIDNLHALSYPLGVSITSRVEDTMEAFAEMARKHRNTASDEATAREFRRAAEARRNQYTDVFTQARKDDPYFDVIDDLISIKRMRGFTLSAFKRELFKVDDLELIHFKYIAMRFEYKVYWSYINYEEYLTFKKHGTELFNNQKI